MFGIYDLISFRLLVFLATAMPSPARGMVYFYERLLPYLSVFPLMTVFQPETAEFVLPPVGEDASYGICVSEALCHIGRLEGLSASHSRSLLFLLRSTIFRFVHNDLNFLSNIAPGEIDLLRITVQTMSIEAAEQAFENSLISPPYLSSLRVLIEEVHTRIETLDRNLLPQLLTCNLTNRAWLTPEFCNWPWFGRLCRDTDVERLAGTAPIPPILRPVELTKVPDKISNFHELCCAMRHTLNLCVLLANQRTLIKNSYTIRVCLIEHLFIRVVPLPLPINHPQRDTNCFWHAQDIRNETQFDILKLLSLLSRHFISSSLSVKYTRSGDAIRILTISCMAIICDAALRKIAVDIPSVVSLHYSGRAMGPIRPFGFDMGKFALESEYLQFTTPETVAARTQVLDYFTQMRTIVTDDHLMFRFDISSKPSPGELTFIHQICLQLGFKTEKEELYLTNENTLILDNYPEIGYFRDIVFSFKLVMIPSSDGLPELKLWEPADAAFKWSFNGTEYIVNGFKRRLECIYPAIEEDDGKYGVAKQRGGLFSRLWSFMGLTSKPRASPSSANPSVLAGERVDNEDDVLHLKTLPDFDGTMGASDSELLLQYLTAPYLRIPLILNFFSNEKRLKCLKNEEIQNVLDAALFEPGRWQAEYVKEPPTCIPAPNRDHLSTPVGLLFNEILMAPNIILAAIQSMLDKVTDMDTGKFSDLSESILYVLRLAVRVEGYLVFLIKNYSFHQQQDHFQDGHEEKKETSTKPILNGAYQEAQVRGLNSDDDVISEAKQCQQVLRNMLETKMFKIVARWIVRAKRDGKTLLACKLHAHLAYIFKNVEYQDLTAKNIFAQVSSQIFLTNNYTYDLDFDEKTMQESGGFFSRKGTENIKSDLGIPQVELFDMYQRNRLKILNWLLAHPDQRNEVMDAVVRLVEEGKKTQDGSDAHAPKNWVSLSREGFGGKFVPEQEVPDFEKNLSPKSRVDFETWLRETTTTIIDTEMNLQLGEFTIKKHGIAPLDQEIVNMNVFRTVFSSIMSGDVIQCAEVMHTTNRMWVRLIGMGYDVQNWTPDTRIPSHGCLITYDLLPVQWIREILDPWRATALEGIDLYASKQSIDNDCIAVLYGHLVLQVDGEEEKSNEKEKEKWKTLKEIVVYRHLKTFHIFNVMSHGRRFYRSLVFSSDPTYTLHDMFLNDGQSIGGTFRQTCGTPNSHEMPSTSLVITRYFSEKEVTEYKPGAFQTFIPWYLLKGLLPAALLEQYLFWQNPDDTLTGYLIQRSNVSLEKNVIRVRIQQTSGTNDLSGIGNSVAFGSVSRIPILDRSEVVVEQDPNSESDPQMLFLEDTTKPTLYLINLLHILSKGPENLANLSWSSIYEFAKLLLRLDSLSNILVWSKIDPLSSAPDISIDLVELPRLHLTFEKRLDRDGNVRYYCLEQTGLFLADNDFQAEAQDIIAGIPHAILLCNVENEKFVMLPATAKPSMIKVRGDKYSYQLSLNRMDERWLDNITIPYFIYPIHSSGGFLSSKSIASTLYLLLFRTLTRNYPEAFKLVETCVCDTELNYQEKQIYEAFGEIKDSLYPESHAMRLKLYFITYGFSDIMPYPFDVRKEMLEYLRCSRRVASNCRLNAEEEAFILARLESEVLSCDGRDYILRIVTI